MTGRLLAYAQLVRLPNVFTAFADILVGALLTITILPMRGEYFQTLWLLLASGCLYLSGMAWNDFFDRREDAQSRPQRPIPSGRISPRRAACVASGLMMLGLFFTVPARGLSMIGITPISPVAIGIALALAILLYDSFLKRTPLGPIGMGLCRFLNVLLGFSGFSPHFDGIENARPCLYAAAVIGLYIVGVTWFARTEEGTSRKTHLLAAFGVMIAALLLALAVPIHLAEGTVTPLYPYLLVAFGFWIGLPLASAIQRPTPQPVQLAVKRCILGLILLDAILATAFVGPAGLLIGLLLLPATWLGKWVYST